MRSPPVTRAWPTGTASRWTCPSRSRPRLRSLPSPRRLPPTATTARGASATFCTISMSPRSPRARSTSRSSRPAAPGRCSGCRSRPAPRYSRTPRRWTVAAGPFLGAVLQAAAFGLELTKLQQEHGHSLPQLITAREDALSALSSAMETSRKLRTRYTRATNVWRRFVSDKGPLGGPISQVLAGTENLEPAEQVLAQLRDLRAIDRLIDDTDKQLNPVAARRSKIIAGARDDLREHTSELLDSLRVYVEAARAVVARQKGGTSDQLAEAVESLTRAVAGSAEDEPALSEAGSLALAQVKRWLQDSLVRPADLPVKELPVSSVLARDLSRSYEVQRLDDGAVMAESVTAEILDAIADRAAEDAYAGFVARDDHAGAEQLIDVLRAERADELADRLASRQPDDRAVSRERLRELLARTERELAQALYTALLSESESADLRGELEKLRDIDVADFATARRRLDDIVQHIAEARGRAISLARQAAFERLSCRRNGARANPPAAGRRRSGQRAGVPGPTGDGGAGPARRGRLRRDAGRLLAGIRPGGRCGGHPGASGSASPQVAARRGQRSRGSGRGDVPAARRRPGDSPRAARLDRSGPDETGRGELARIAQGRPPPSGA